jgi:hypothetical protein
VCAQSSFTWCKRQIEVWQAEYKLNKVRFNASGINRSTLFPHYSLFASTSNFIGNKCIVVQHPFQERSTNKHTYIQIYTHIYTYNIHIHIYIHIYICIGIRIQYTYTDIHIHIQICSPGIPNVCTNPDGETWEILFCEPLSGRSCLMPSMIGRGSQSQKKLPDMFTATLKIAYEKMIGMCQVRLYIDLNYQTIP